MDEFDFIARLLAPLATESGAYGLTDDAASLHLPAGQECVITKDALIESVHFIGDEHPADIARKALRVNLSDLAAMGATPYGYMLALMLHPQADEAWLTAFAGGLQADQQEFGMSLLGGDTTRSQGSFALSVTMLGLAPAGKALRRAGARVGDDIYVSGTIGDAAIGLSIAKEQIVKANNATRAFLLNRYRIPQPRVELGLQLRGIATACMDISDGLVQDLGHLCKQSGVGAMIEWEKIPLSEAARESALAIPQTILAGGDDYELLFTAPPEAAGRLYPLAVQRIGRITEGNDVIVLDKDGETIELAHKGYRHF